MDNLEIRQIELRAKDDEQRIVEGIAVPYGVETNVGAYVERFAQNSISDDVSEVKLKFGHEGLPIGKVVEGRNEEDGFYIRAKISETSQGNDVYTLIRDGVLNKFSVGFIPVESERDGNVVVRNLVSLKEVSVVEQPAYSDAQILAVREDTNDTIKEVPSMESINNDANLEFAVRSVQDEVAELRRAVEAGVQVATPTQTVDTRSAGEVLKAIAAGDEATIRTYAGNTTDNSVMLNTFIGDLTRIVDSPIGVRGLISTGVLPASGNILEYAKLDTNTVTVDEQADEGDDLTYGQVSLTTATAPVKTFGGYTTLSRQAIERSSVNFLDAHMRAMAVAVANNLNGFVRSAFNTQYGAHVTTGGSAVVDLGLSGAITTATYGDWLDAIVEGADKFQTRGWTIDALVVSKDVFKSLMKLEGSDGRPLMIVQGNNGVNTVGAVNPLALGASFAGLTVAVDTALSNGTAAFVNGNAMRLYTNPVVSLTDDNIINLSRDFSVYQYGALANEAPEALVPVVA
jgi:HK97 family phage prohead protease/HK97 family phage major capsid protein